VDAPPEPLTRREHRRLIEIIEREAPQLTPLARDAVNHRWLSDEECAALVNVLLDVFLRSRDQDDEPRGEGADAMTCSAGSRCSARAAGARSRCCFRL
jgi:hypothetical protein